MLSGIGAPLSRVVSRVAGSVRMAQKCQERLLQTPSVPPEDVRGGYTGMAVSDRSRLEDVSQSAGIAFPSNP